LDYQVSDRIKFSTEFSFTDNNNKQNYGGLLNTAYRIMPNMSIYAQNPDGTDTENFFKMPQNYSTQLSDQKGLINPVALGTLATKNTHDIRIVPIFRIQYDFTDPAKQLLRFKSYVAFDINSESTYSYLPKELIATNWSSGVNNATTMDRKYRYISTDNNLAWSPKFENPDHSLTLYGSFQLGTSNSRYQYVQTFGAPNGITASTASGYVSNFATGPSESRWLAYLGKVHYVFKDRYVADFTLRRGGSTKFGDDRKWGNFPGVSFAWNIADESFLEGAKGWLSTLKFRPSWGFTGNEPKSEYLYYSMYSAYSSYLGIPTIRPDNIQLTNLRWEKVTSWNWGLDFGMFDDAFYADFNFYFKNTEDMLFPSVTIPSSSGFGALSYQNAGTMENSGWELNLNANKLIKIGNFNAGIVLNFSNYINKIIDLKQSILDDYNKGFAYTNASYLTRIQENNAYGSIYGFRYKGVYQYSEYEPGREGKSPFALDQDGQLIRDANGEPLRMTFAAGKTAEYKFKGGDAMYDDINHDGNINELDIVYLGNSNPLFNGGIQFKFNYKRFSATVFSNYRIGNKVVNMARMNAENMYGNSNQAASVNWRWRKDGDETPIPRAMIGSGYNFLGSDRFVEDASFIRVKNIQLNYSFDPRLIKQLNLTQLSLYMSINNPIVFTNYSGVDPEVNYGSLGVSTDNSQTPRSKYITAGVTIVL
jgi:TonB-linked SusC/RagA family outer membrane protein